MTKEQLIEMLKEYICKIQDASDYYTVYASIWKAAQDYNEQVNLSPGFFHISLEACMYSCLMELAKLYDDTVEERTLKKLIVALKSCSGFFPIKIQNEYTLNSGGKLIDNVIINVEDDIKAFEIKIHEMQAVVKNLKGRRDKFLAHNDKKYFLKRCQLAEDYPITFNEAKCLIQLAYDYCNKFYTYLTSRTLAMTSLNADDLDVLLQYVNIEPGDVEVLE